MRAGGFLKSLWGAKSWLMVATFVSGQGLYRVTHGRWVNTVNKLRVYKSFDLRGENYADFEKRSEREYFRLKGGLATDKSLPALSSLTFSLTWLRVLYGLHEEASLEGDFSWLFQQLRFISLHLPRGEKNFQSAVLPFFVVLGKDPAGAQFLLNEKLSRLGSIWQIPYWAGFHAFENLGEKKMAGDFFLKAATLPGAPIYLAVLGFRLSRGDEGNLSNRELRTLALRELEPELKEKIKLVRPEWFQMGAR